MRQRHLWAGEAGGLQHLTHVVIIPGEVLCAQATLWLVDINALWLAADLRTSPPVIAPANGVDVWGAVERTGPRQALHCLGQQAPHPGHHCGHCYEDGQRGHPHFSQFIRLKSLLISPRVKLQLRVRIMAPQPSIWWQNSIENCGAYNIWRWKYCLFVAPNALDRKITNIKSFNNI